MASVEAAPQIRDNLSIGDMKNSGLFSLTIAALRIRTPWSAPVQKTEKIYTLDEISWHDNSADCWIVIYDRVYDITKFLDQHPGGFDVLLEYAGRDATLAFRGTGHSQEAISSLKPYLVGHLPLEECIYRRPGSVWLSDLPE